MRPRHPQLRGLPALALALLAACSDRPVNVDELLRQGDVFLDPETLEPFEGGFYELHQGTSVVASRGEQRDGRIVELDTFGENGQLLARITVTDDGYDLETYFQTGELENHEVTLDDSMTLHESYYRSGQLRFRGSSRNGTVVGLHEWFGEGGERYEGGRYHEGQRCGEWLLNGEVRAFPTCPR